MTTLSRPDRPLPIHPRFAGDAMYRPFFLTGILVILTAGAAWGALLLWQIAQAGSFTDVSIHAVNAHGHAQIFGWVGLFIMGFAYQAFPRMWNTRLAAPHLAITAFALMLLGLIMRTGAMWAAETWAFAPAAVQIGGFLQVVAVAIFAAQIVVTFHRSDERVSPAIAFIFGALFWFLAMTVMALWHTLMLMEATTREALLAQIATYQAALRDMQIHGLALFMILGVSIRFFPGMFGLPKTPSTRAWWGFGLISTAVVAEIILLIAAQRTGNHALAGALLAPWIMLTAGIMVIVLPWRLWRPLPQTHRSTKFVRAAYLWLGISLIMLLAFPLYMLAHDSAFSHAYYGAIRHAITVGFISMMIMGVAAKVVPTLCGVDHRALSKLWIPFILVNVGCALRVSTQVATDWHEVGFALIGFSGMMELTGLAWWGAGLLALMVGWRPREHTGAAGDATRNDHTRPDAGSVSIDPDWTMRDLAERRPDLAPAMARLGLDTCCSAERSVHDMAARHGMRPDDLIACLERNESAPAGTHEAGEHQCGCARTGANDR